MEFIHEIIIPNEDLPFKLFMFEGKDGNYRRAKHWHRSLEIFLVLEGELEFFVNNERFPLTAIDFMIVNSNEIHSIESPYPNHTIVVQIPLHCFSGYFGEEDYVLFTKQSEECNLELAQLIARMYRTYQKKELAYALKVKALFYELLYLLVTEFMRREDNRGNIRRKQNLDKLSKITAYMKKNYARDISLEQVAQEFGYTPSYLSRMFKQYADINYKTYLLNLRTEYGFREMMNSDHSLSDVAVNNGFPDSRAFAKAFCARYGCLPSEYRKRGRGAAGS